jgi:hypothetical protein
VLLFALSLPHDHQHRSVQHACICSSACLAALSRRQPRGNGTYACLLVELLVDGEAQVPDAGDALAQLVQVLVLLPVGPGMQQTVGAKPPTSTIPMQLCCAVVKFSAANAIPPPEAESDHMCCQLHISSMFAVLSHLMHLTCLCARCLETVHQHIEHPLIRCWHSARLAAKEESIVRVAEQPIAKPSTQENRRGAKHGCEREP